MKTKGIRRAQIFGWVSLVIGAALMAWGWFNLDQARASRGWPTAEATIRSSKVVARRSSNSSGTSASWRYNPKIVFDFMVGSTPYIGDRVSFRDDHYGRRELAVEIAERYPVGRKVKVYYLPANPAEAVLEPVYDWSTYIPPAIGLLFFATGALLLRFIRKSLVDQKVPDQPV